MSIIAEHNVEDWVGEAQNDADTEFRQAVHTILYSVASDGNLKSSMILKGGILLAIRYQSHRYTKDIDFSTEKRLGGEITVESVRETLNRSLALSVASLDYGLDCKVQSCKVQPKAPDATYPSIKLKIGYAYQGTPKHKRLISLKCPTSISIDYSFNESIPNIENISLLEGSGILVYSLTDLIAEKYRSLLQQEIRNRNRRQDVYDLNYLIDYFNDIDIIEKSEILNCLLVKSQSRNIDPNITSFDSPELKIRASKDYPTLEDDLDVDLPDFDTIFHNVSAFYKSLPWESR